MCMHIHLFNYNVNSGGEFLSVSMHDVCGLLPGVIHRHHAPVSGLNIGLASPTNYIHGLCRLTHMHAACTTQLHTNGSTALLFPILKCHYL